MSDAMSHDSRCRRAERERAQASYGHLPDAELDAVIEAALRRRDDLAYARIKLEAEEADAVRTVDMLVTEYCRRHP